MTSTPLYLVDFERNRWIRRLVAASLALASLALLTACGHANSGATAQQQHALAMWQERCKGSGEFIHKTVDNVDGLLLINVRATTNFDDQFRLDDPYGHDVTGDDYILNFLRGAHRNPNYKTPVGFPPRIGYSFVEARSPKDGQLYRYTGRFEEPWQTNKSYLKGYIRFVMDKAPIAASTARYGVRFDDISTREEREFWIASSSLKVIDVRTREVLAERIGYMVDLAQGSRAGQRSPWLFAADNACPNFYRNYSVPVSTPGFSVQTGQTLDFVAKTLKPSL